MPGWRAYTHGTKLLPRPSSGLAWPQPCACFLAARFWFRSPRSDRSLPPPDGSQCAPLTLCMRPKIADSLIALLGALVGLAMMLMKLLPFVPGSFSGWEWLAFTLWIILGFMTGRRSIGREQGAQLATESTYKKRDS